MKMNYHRIILRDEIHSAQLKIIVLNIYLFNKRTNPAHLDLYLLHLVFYSFFSFNDGVFDFIYI